MDQNEVGRMESVSVHQVHFNPEHLFSVPIRSRRETFGSVSPALARGSRS